MLKERKTHFLFIKNCIINTILFKFNKNVLIILKNTVIIHKLNCILFHKIMSFFSVTQVCHFIIDIRENILLKVRECKTIKENRVVHKK